ncbi:hypothetical protein [Oceanithermus sp.]
MKVRRATDKRFSTYCLLLGISTLAWSFALVALPFEALDHPDGKQLLAHAVLLGLLPRLLAPLFAPWLKRSLRGINAAGAATATLILLWLSVHAAPLLIQLAYVLIGINVVLNSTTPSLLVRAWFPQAEWMKANALVGVVTLGIPVVAWPVAGFISGLLGYNFVLRLAALGFLAVALLAFTAIPAGVLLLEEGGEETDGRLPVLSYAPLLLIVLVALAWLGYLQVAVPALLDRFPGAAAIYGWYGGLFSLGMAAGAGALFAAGNRLEPVRALGFSGFLLTAAVLTYIAPGTGWLLAAGGAYGLGLGAVQTAGATYLQEVVPQNLLARVLTWMSSATAAASMLGAYLAGRLLEAHVLLAVGVAVLLAMATLLFWTFGQVRLLPHGMRLRLWLLRKGGERNA